MFLWRSIPYKLKNPYQNFGKQFLSTTRRLMKINCRIKLKESKHIRFCGNPRCDPLAVRCIVPYGG